jgi:AP-2 complex subunit alpha
MRGLTTFISDLRNARARELEDRRINKELANIRGKFKGMRFLFEVEVNSLDAKLNGYQKKKYVCKLLYIYILGHPLTFGHLESLSLLTSPRYSEKQIGYLAVTLLLNERNDLINLVLNSIRRDLVESNNELWNCMALHAIANVGGREMGEALGPDVFRLLISPYFPI